MRFKELIKHLDLLTKIRIFMKDESDIKTWEGIVLDIPWIYMDMVLNTDSEGEAINVYYEKKDDKIEPYMNIRLKNINL